MNSSISLALDIQPEINYMSKMPTNHLELFRN